MKNILLIIRYIIEHPHILLIILLATILIGIVIGIILRIHNNKSSYCYYIPPKTIPPTKNKSPEERYEEEIYNSKERSIYRSALYDLEYDIKHNTNSEFKKCEKEIINLSIYCKYPEIQKDAQQLLRRYKEHLNNLHTYYEEHKYDKINEAENYLSHLYYNRENGIEEDYNHSIDKLLEEIKRMKNSSDYDLSKRAKEILEDYDFYFNGE